MNALSTLIAEAAAATIKPKPAQAELPAWKKASRNKSPHYSAAPSKVRTDPAPVHGDKIRTAPRRLKSNPTKSYRAMQTNNQRVVAARAKRLGISVNEYAAKFK